MADITVKYLGVTMVMAQSGQNKAPHGAGAAGAGLATEQVPDKRILEAIIRAVYRYDSHILRYDWIASELEDLVGEDEYWTLETVMYESIVDGKIKNVRMIRGPTESADKDVVAVAPCALTEEQWRSLEELAELYDYSGYIDPTMGRYSLVVKYDRPSLDIVMHNLIRAWCMLRYVDDSARAVYDAFNATYKLGKSFQAVTRDIEV